MAKINMNKNMKKRSASISEISEKKIGISENLNKESKKKKTENGTVQNGQPNKQIAKNSPKKFNKNEKKNDLGIVKNPKKKATNEAGLKKSKKETLTTEELLKLRQEYRKKRKENRSSQTHLLSSKLSVEDIKKKIELIEKRAALSRSAKRKLAALKKRLRVKEGVGKIKQVAKTQLEKGRNEKSLEVVKQKQVQNVKSAQEKVLAKSNKENNKRDAKKTKTPLKQKNEENYDDDEEDEENEDDMEIDDELSEDVDGTDVEEGDDDDDDDDDEEEEDDDDDDDDEDDDDDDDEDVEEEGKNDKSNEQDKDNEIKKSNVQKGKSANVEEDGKKRRYVLFVGNLPYNITNEELKKHFLTKVSQVVDIRIPRKDDNTTRGFGYVELANNTDYEKSLSLNHSFVNGRRINVQYSGPDRKTAVAKNFKLHALQKAGKFAGGRNRYNQKYANNKGKQNMRTAKT